MGDVFAPQHPADDFGGLHRGRAHQHRLTRRIPLLDLLDQGVELLPARLEDQIILVLAHADPVRRDDHHAQPVDVLEFVRLRLRRPGHARQLFIEPEIVLDGDRRQRLGLAVNLHALLGLHRLVQAVTPAAARHQPARVLVDDQHLVLLHHVVDILFKNAVSPEQLADVVNPLAGLLVPRLGRLLPFQLFLRPQRRVRVDVVVGGDQVRHEEKVRIRGIEEFSAHFREIGLAVALVDREVHLLLRLVELGPAGVLVHFQLRVVDRPPRGRILHELQEQFVPGRAQLHPEEQPARSLEIAGLHLLLGLVRPIRAETVLLPHQTLDGRTILVELVGRDRHRPRDDQRRARLVDQDAVDLVDDRIKVSALDLILRGCRHAVVAQIIKTEFGAGPVRDVASILGPALRLALSVLETTHRQPQLPVHLPHPFRIPGGEVVVHRHHVDPLARQRVEVGRQRGHQGFALARGHLRDPAGVQDDSPDQLDIERDHLPEDFLAADPDGSFLLREPPAAVFHHGKGLGQKGVEGRPLGEAFPESSGFRLQFFPGKGAQPFLQAVDLLDRGHHPADFPLVLRAEDFL